MGLFSKCMITSVGIAVITPLFLKAPNGQPLQSLEALNLGVLGTMASNTLEKVSPSSKHDSDNGAAIIHSESTPSVPSLPSGKGANSFYKWKDEQGVWQFTLTPPKNAQIGFTVITTDPNANVIQSLSKKDIADALGWSLTEAEEGNQQGATKPASEMPSMPFPSTIPASDIPKLIEQAKATQQLMHDRGKVLDTL